MKKSVKLQVKEQGESKKVPGIKRKGEKETWEQIWERWGEEKRD